MNQCVNYSPANLPSTVQLVSLRNPKYVVETKSFQISVLDSNTNMIVNLNQGVTYTPTPGAINAVSMVPLLGYDIQTTTDITLAFTPTHSVSGPSQIMMTLPSNIDFSCSLASTVNLKPSPTCKVLTSNKLQFDNVFVNDQYTGTLPLSITFRNRLLPASLQDVSGITIQTFAVVNSKALLID